MALLVALAVDATLHRLAELLKILGAEDGRLLRLRDGDGHRGAATTAAAARGSSHTAACRRHAAEWRGSTTAKRGRGGLHGGPPVGQARAGRAENNEASRSVGGLL